MARQLKLPVATVARSTFEADPFAVLTVDMRLLAKSKTFAKLKEQAPHWDDDQRFDYLLALMAEGPV